MTRGPPRPVVNRFFPTLSKLVQSRFVLFFFFFFVFLSILILSPSLQNYSLNIPSFYSINGPRIVSNRSLTVSVCRPAKSFADREITESVRSPYSSMCRRCFAISSRISSSDFLLFIPLPFLDVGTARSQTPPLDESSVGSFSKLRQLFETRISNRTSLRALLFSCHTCILVILQSRLETRWLSRLFVLSQNK